MRGRLIAIHSLSQDAEVDFFRSLHFSSVLWIESTVSAPKYIRESTLAGRGIDHHST